MGFNDQHYTIDVKDARTGEPIITDVFTFVYTVSTKTLATVYTNSIRGTLANPITRTQFAVDDKIDFWSAATSHDIFVNDGLGNSAFVAGMTPNDHTILLNRDGIDKCLIAAMGANDNSEADLGIDLPRFVKVYDCWVEVVTVDATETVDLGILSTETSGDANGLLTAVSVATAGFIKPWSITETTTEDYTSAPYFGSLMGVGTAGTSTANDNGTAGGAGHVVTATSGVSLSYTGSAGTDTTAGYFYVFFKHLR